MDGRALARAARPAAVADSVVAVSEVVRAGFPQSDCAAAATAGPWSGPGGVALATELTVSPWLPSAHVTSPGVVVAGLNVVVAPVVVVGSLVVVVDQDRR